MQFPIEVDIAFDGAVNYKPKGQVLYPVPLSVGYYATRSPEQLRQEASRRDAIQKMLKLKTQYNSTRGHLAAQNAVFGPKDA